MHFFQRMYGICPHKRSCRCHRRSLSCSKVLKSVGDLAQRYQAFVNRGDAQVVRQLHSRFYDELLSHISIEAWESDSEVAFLFKKFSPFFRVYGVFIHQIEVVGNDVQNLATQHPALEQLLDFCRQDPRCHRHTFESFLIMPIQVSLEVLLETCSFLYLE